MKAKQDDWFSWNTYAILNNELCNRIIPSKMIGLKSFTDHLGKHWAMSPALSTTIKTIRM